MTEAPLEVIVDRWVLPWSHGWSQMVVYNLKRPQKLLPKKLNFTEILRFIYRIKLCKFSSLFHANLMQKVKINLKLTFDLENRLQRNNNHLNELTRPILLT